MSESDEDTRLLSVAEAICERQPVDWQDLEEHSGPLDLQIVTELKALESLARSHEETPKSWGPFPIIGEIARGAFGTVYIAADPALGLTVALKVIRPRNPDVAIDPAKALTEARLLAKITHPNIVRVYRAERIGNEVGLVMELVKGRTIDDLVQNESLFNASEAALIGLDLCRALAAVHAVGALHGDIKAHNVMRGEGGRTMLMDFGAAKDLNVPRPTGNDFVGTPLYMAPEVFHGQARSKTTDVYSLGVLLYYMVSGTYPVPGSTRTEVARRHSASGDRRPLRDVRPDLPDAFIRVVDRAVAQRPEDRYQSAGEFESALAGTLPRFDPKPAPYARPLLSGRAPIVIAISAVALVIVMALGVAAFYRSKSQDAGSRGTSTSPQTPAADEAGAYRINAALYRKQNGIDLPVVESTRLAVGDHLSLDVEVSAPVYMYVVNEDDHGESYLLFPLPGLMSNPLPAGRHRLPGTIDGSEVSWKVSSTGGKEHFLVMASPTPPLPLFQKVFESLPPASFGKLAVKLTPDHLGVLRSVGGLAVANPPMGQQLHATPTFAIALTGKEETARGVWIRQATVDNPDQ
jgi:eukaryotic-like serine/threonine-protein kinase